MSSAPPRRTPDGWEFGPDANGTRYLCIAYHRDGTPGKAQWNAANVPIHREYGIFRDAHTRGRLSTGGDYWGVGDDDGGLVLGTRGERVCKFPRNGNPAAVPWHGYPVSWKVKPKTPRPDKSDLNQWVQQKLITETLALDIFRRRI